MVGGACFFGRLAGIRVRVNLLAVCVRHLHVGVRGGVGLIASVCLGVQGKVAAVQPDVTKQVRRHRLRTTTSKDLLGHELLSASPGRN